MSEDAQFLKVCMVRFERLLPGPVERIWRLLTDASLLPEWCGEGGIEPRPGGAVSLMGGHIRGIVTQWLPSKYLAYSWNVFGGDEEISRYPESWMSFELNTRGGNVDLTLCHVPVLERFERQDAMGWHTFLDMLDAAARHAPMEPRATYMKRNATRYEIDLDNLER